MLTKPLIPRDTEEAELAGLDALDREDRTIRRSTFWHRTWRAGWPKLAAGAIVIVAWQLIVWSHWKPEYILPGPNKVFPELRHQLGESVFWRATGVTMSRAVIGFALAILIGSLVGITMAGVRPLRLAIGSLVTGLQTMPSVAWFPLAIVLFGLKESAILFVVIIGAAPSIANGVLSGVDQVPPLLVRYGRSLRTSRLALLRHIALPAAVPNFAGGLKQGWSFAWRSLMAGELLVTIAKRPSLGFRLSASREFSNYTLMIALLIVILVIGMVIDALFNWGDRAVRRRWGLVDSHTGG